MFMGGQCWEELGELDAACDCYMEALAIDPMAISAAERLRDLAPALSDRGVEAWSARCLERLCGAPENEPPELLPYQRYAGVLGGSATAAG